MKGWLITRTGRLFYGNQPHITLAARSSLCGLQADNTYTGVHKKTSRIIFSIILVRSDENLYNLEDLFSSLPRAQL